MMGSEFPGEALARARDLAHDDFLDALGDEALDDGEADGAAA